MDYLRNNKVRSSNIDQQPLPTPLFLFNGINNNQQIKSQMNNESFHDIMKPIIAVSQFFGIFPINGIQNLKPNKYIFKFPSLITCYSLMIILLIGFCCILTILQTINGINHSGENIFRLISLIVFSGYNFLVQLILFCKSPNWIKLQINWQKLEMKLDNFYQIKFHLRSKLQKISLIYFLIAFFEHIYSYASGIIQVKSTEKYFNSIGKNFLFMFFESLDEISNSHYTFFVGIIGSIIRTVATFTWNFCDLFIILVSIGLAERYNHLNRIVSYKISNDSIGRINWCKIKEKYVMMNKLVQETDDIVSSLIFLSCSMNVYQICKQTSEGIIFIKEGKKIEIYLIISFLLMISRIMAVVLCSAKVDDESGNALSIFAHGNPSVFIIETIWMQQQLSINKVSLTAMKFFPISRNFILTIFGAIITYEMFYMQLRLIG